MGLIPSRSVIFLTQLGAPGRDSQVHKGSADMLEHARSHDGGLSADGKPGRMIHCVQGNLAAALIDPGRLGDERLGQPLMWLERSITGEGIAPAEARDAPVRYYRSGNSAPGFVCSANSHLPCAWGAVKAMWALRKAPARQRTAAREAAIAQGIAFLLSHDPAIADYQMGYANGSWFKFGYPIGCVTPVLQNLASTECIGLGYSGDARLGPALDLVLSKQNPQGRWPLDYANMARCGWKSRSKVSRVSD